MDFDLDLSLVNVICGDNFAGKTSILRGIRLALTGYLPPPLGKTPGSLYKLAGNSDGPGSVVLELDTDGNRRVAMSISKDEAGKCSITGGVPMDLQLPEMLCDPKTFFGMTGAERIATVFKACDVSKSGFGADSLKARLGEIQIMPVAVCEESLSLVSKTIDKAFSLASLQSSCEHLLTVLKTWQKTAKDKKDEASGQFAAFKGGLGPRPVDQSAAIAAKEKEIAAAGASNAVERGLAAQRIETVKNNLAEHCAVIGQYELVPEKIEAIQKSLDESQERLKTAMMKEPVDTQPLQEAITRLRQLRSDQEQLVTEQVAEQDAQLDVLKMVRKLKLCENCKVKLTTAAQDAIEEAKLYIPKVQKQIAGTLKKITEADEVLAKAVTLNSTETKLVDGLHLEIDQLTKRKAVLEKLYAEYKAAVVAYLGLLPAVDNSKLQGELAELREKQRAFEGYKANIAKRDALEQAVLAEACKESVCKAVTKIVWDEQSRIMDFAFNEVLGVAKHFTDGLLNSPLEFRDGELGRRVSQLDVDNGIVAPVDSWISHETFSGTEQALAYIGFAIALCQKAAMKLVFIDDVVIQSDRKLKVLHRFLELAKAGVIDQAFYADADSRDFTSMSTSSEINVIRL